jgi:hypothetical protein
MRTFARYVHLLNAIQYDYLASQFLIDTELPSTFFWAKSKNIWLFFLNRYFANMQYITHKNCQSQC